VKATTLRKYASTSAVTIYPRAVGRFSIVSTDEQGQRSDTNRQRSKLGGFLKSSGFGWAEPGHRRFSLHKEMQKHT
jgi:hypothetical protein